MITKNEINRYLDSIPSVSKTIKSTLSYLDKSDMIQAANIAKEDRAFVEYISKIVNKPIFGFRNDIKNINQIFGILGLTRTRGLVYGYYLHLILPKEWEVFRFSNKKFQDLQINLIIEWEKILDLLQIKNSDLEQSITLVPASLIVCEMLFRDIKDTISILRKRNNISYDEILYKMSGYTLFDIVGQIAKKWRFDDAIFLFIKEALSNSCEKEESLYLRLLLSYEMSKPYIINSGLNDFFDFKLDFTEDEIIKFKKIINMEK